MLLALAAELPASASGGPTLTPKQRDWLDENWRYCLRNKKGPFTANMCVCKDGTKELVRKLPTGELVTPCAGKFEFCESFRSKCGKELAGEGMYVGNLFERDLYEWDEIPDHHDLVRGYVLEKYFIETHPQHKLSTLRSYGGLAGAEYEARSMPRFFERYLALESFTEARHYLLAYELQRRYFVRNDQGQITKARNLATAIQARNADFKPLRDRTHNQISAALIPQLAAWRDGLPPGDPLRARVDELITEVDKLTSLDESALREQLPALEDAAVRESLARRLPTPDADDVARIAALAAIMVEARHEVEAKRVAPADRRRLLDVAITAAAVIQARGSRLLDAGTPLPARRHVELMHALGEAAYGAGLLMRPEREAAAANLRPLLEKKKVERAELETRLEAAGRVVEWAQRGILFSFDEALPAWLHLLPDVRLFPDDVIRGSPLLLYGRVHTRLEDFALGGRALRHEILGAEADRGVRALNPGLALATLRVAPAADGYARDEVVALVETPADLQPAAGIFTQGEGNVVSHVQLLARALGIPNVVLGPEVFARFQGRDGETILFVATPGGRVVVRAEGDMTDADRTAVAEYRRNEARSEDGALGAAAGRLRIDRERLDLSAATALPLKKVRRVDSGVRCGPKAAFLGELTHLFPDKVARGVVVPFGAYHAHFRRVPVALPKPLAKQGLASEGEPLAGFVERSYRVFFDEMIPAGTAERELSAWIQPRLEIMRHSIRQAPLDPALRESIRAALDRAGLLAQDGRRTRGGLFVRSDTNVEDLDEFNGAGLNLTLFNLGTLEEVYDGIQEVWASPFTMRSFSWRQTLIDDPMWVLPSVVILESVPSEKSGVLVTADIHTGDPSRMLVATSEGVGGAVDGTPAETLVWSPEGVELVTMFKSPWRRLLREGGGSEMVPSTRGERVLDPEELRGLVATAQELRDRLEPARDAAGRPRPWDIEFGFAGGKLWLFQARPFIGNEQLRNMPALAAYEPSQDGGPRILSLEEKIP
ncbi:MAG: PEP/pyruvate-binding domain-containing protein [Myxococcota bacterium]|nr:PEP/pyruvate-binding domain-containing protein [Myxococcota bacterium]